MIFIDTTVLIAASTPSHTRHEACVDLLSVADKRGGACASHSLAEIFSVMTGRPAPLRMPPADAATLVVHTRRRFTIISLTPNEYVAAIDNLAKLGHSGGIIYDALLLACARKVNASRIIH